MFDRYLTAEIETDEVSADIGDTKVLGNPQDSYIPIPPVAEIGQTIVVKEVDRNGRPTKWEAVYISSSGGGGGDGFSPIVDVKFIDGGHRVEITDKNGKKTFDVMDGKDGYTPVKGTDYFTPSDKSEMVQSVLDSLPTWEGGNY